MKYPAHTKLITIDGSIEAEVLSKKDSVLTIADNSIFVRYTSGDRTFCRVFTEDYVDRMFKIVSKPNHFDSNLFEV